MFSAVDFCSGNDPSHRSTCNVSTTWSQWYFWVLSKFSYLFCHLFSASVLKVWFVFKPSRQNLKKLLLNANFANLENVVRFDHDSSHSIWKKTLNLSEILYNCSGLLKQQVLYQALAKCWAIIVSSLWKGIFLPKNKEIFSLKRQVQNNITKLLKIE